MKRATRSTSVPGARQMTGSNLGRVRGTRRRVALVSAVLILLAALAGLVMIRNSIPLPVVSTLGLDPLVRRVVEQALEEVRARPKSGAAWGRLGSVLMHYEFVDEARLAFQRAERLSPEEPRWPYLNGILMMNRDAAGALASLRRASEIPGEQPDMVRLRLANFELEQGWIAEAEAGFRQVLDRDPSNAKALLGLARLRKAQVRIEDCERLLGNCLTNAHTARAAHTLLAQVQFAKGERNKADATLARARDLQKDVPWPDPFWNEAARWKVGRKAMLEEASDILDGGRPAEALPILTRVVRDYRDDPDGWYLLGWTLNQLQRSADAEGPLREHLRLAPDSPKGSAQLAVSLLGKQRYEEAEKILRSAIVRKPDWRELHSNLGFACLQRGREDEALVHYRTAVSCDPNHVPSWMAVAELLLRQGHRADAAQALGRVLELAPNHVRARELLERERRGQ